MGANGTNNILPVADRTSVWRNKSLILMFSLNLNKIKNLKTAPEITVIGATLTSLTSNVALSLLVNTVSGSSSWL